MKKFTSPLSILFLSVALSGAPQAAETTAPLTWTDAVRIAAQSNPTLQSSRSHEQSSLARYHGSYNEILPRLGLSSTYSDSQGHSTESRWGAAASASWNLFDLGRFADISVARAARARAAANLRSTSATVRQSLFRAYAGLIYQQSAIDVSSMVFKIRSNNARLVTLRYNSGRESKGNRMTSDAELLQAEVDVNQSKRDLKAAQQELNRQLGRDRYVVVEATGDLTVSIPAEPDLNALTDRHPLIAQRQADLDSSKASVREAKAALFPTLEANYTRSFSGPNYFPRNASWSASGVLSVPIFGAGPTASFYSIRAAVEERSSAEADLLEARAQVRAGLESAWAEFQRAVDQVKVQQAFLRATRQRNQEADIRYSSGLMSYEDWARIVTDRVNLEKSMIQAARDAALAEAAWRQAEGLGLEEDL